MDSEHFRCHWANAADTARCDQALVWAEQAWQAQVVRIGFRAPVSDANAGGAGTTDIYLADAGGPGMAYVDCDPEDPDCFDPDGGDGFAAAPAYIVIDPQNSDVDFPHFVHHEFNHVLQYGTDFAEPSLVVWEATSVAAERWTDPSWPTLVDDVADFQAAPHLSPFLQDGYYLADCCDIESWYEYGAVTWLFWLDHRHGDDAGAVGPELWAGLAGPPGDGNTPSVLDSLGSIWGSPVGTAGFDLEVLDLAAERVRMGTDAQAPFFPWDDEGIAIPRQALTEGENRPDEPPFPFGISLGLVDVDRPADIRMEPEDPADRLTMLVFDEDLEIISDGAVSGWSVAPGSYTLAVVNLGPTNLTAADNLSQVGFTWSIEGQSCGCGSAPRARWTPVLLVSIALMRRRATRRDGKS